VHIFKYILCGLDGFVEIHRPVSFSIFSILNI
jgi:hypothetical protein